MLRGFIRTTCPHCGHTFTAPDIEDNATVFSAPVKCPNCGKTFRPKSTSGFSGLFGLLKQFFTTTHIKYAK